MSNWRYSICDPLKPEILDKGEVSAEAFIRVMEQFPWEEELKKLNEAEKNGKKIYFSPSLELENTVKNHGVTASAVGTPDDYSFMVFYKRPKANSAQGLYNVSDRDGISLEEVHMIFEGLLEEDYSWLEENLG